MSHAVSTPRPLRAVFLCAVIACAGAPWLAQAQGAMPPMKQEGAVRFVCGGIGSDESTAMRAAMKSHPLSLLFARAGGDYLANVDVAINEQGGKPVAVLRADGPVCLLDLPAGSYVVEATSEGGSKSQRVTVGAVPRTLDFRF